MCPIGTYANALAEIINIPGVPPQGGKGITGGLVGATTKPCTPCCPAGVGTCGLTTNKPGSTSYKDCVLVKPDVQPYCCGTDKCTLPVPRPPTAMPQAAAAAAAAAAAKPDFEYAYRGASVTIVMPIHGINSAGILIPPTVDWSRPLDRITGGRRPPGSGSSSWGGGSDGSSRWGGDGDSDSSSGGWNSGSSGGSAWNGGGSSSGSSRWGGSSSGSNSWDGSARSRNWGATISDVGVIDKSDLLPAAEVPPFLNVASSTDSSNSTNSSSVANSSRSDGDDTADSSSSSTGSISSTEQVTWWGSTPDTGPHPLGACTANPRTPVDSSSGLAANTPWVVSYWADLTPGTTCQFTRTALAATACTGSQLAPYLVLLAAHCVDPTLLRLALPACPNLVLVSARACYSFNRAPKGPFNCTDNGINAVGASWYPRTNDASLGPVTPNDQAILFMSTSRPGPFYAVSVV